MEILLAILATILILIPVIIIGVPLYALLDTLSLPRGCRPWSEPFTIQQAA